MSYTPAMLESIKRVEETRARRLHEAYLRLMPQERQTLLQDFHPDYIRQSMRELRLGPNKGSRTPNELADLLEARPILTPDFDLSRVDYDVDVLIIGGGGAGSSAALLAQETLAALNGGEAKILLATKLRHGDANTMMAQGGIQAADKENDSPAIHYLDVLGGGGFHNDPDLVEALVRDAPPVIQWLEGLGCMFDKMPDGTMKTIHGGGTCRKRMHAARDYSGAEIMRTLRDEVRNRQIPVVEFSPAVELLLDDKGQCAGAVLKNLETEEYLVVRAKTNIIATGGSGRLHYQGFPTTNHYGATGDGLVLAYRLGAKLAFIDTMQYHPTGVAFPEQILGLLVTEKVRGLGAQLTNADGEQFIYPLETRDVVSAAIIRECKERGKGISTPTGQVGVWLDSPMIEILKGEGTSRRELPAMWRQYMRFNIDMTRQPILTYPTLHYQNGGIAIQPDCSTSIPNLFVAGEASGGVHGRNRLMGNSLLDVTVFGRRAGVAAAQRSREVALGQLTLQHLAAWQQQLTEAGLEPTITAPMILPDYTRHVHTAEVGNVEGVGAE
jgi:succinate dehydrogenase/fumarate reductase flavoprotein subunit